MDVILLQRVAKLGQMGDVVSVKSGFARNFLLPSGKALRASKANKIRFESERAQLEARNLELKKEAEAVAEKLDGEKFVAIRQAGDSGQLYGSVTTRDIAKAVTAGGFSIERNQISLDMPIKLLGLHDVNVVLHPEWLFWLPARTFGQHQRCGHAEGQRNVRPLRSRKPGHRRHC